MSNPQRKLSAVQQLQQTPQHETATYTRPELRLVPQTKKAQRSFGMTVACGLTVLGVIFGQMGLVAVTSMDAYELTALKSEVRDVTRVNTVLAQNVEAKNSPQNLADNAASLGMVLSESPAYLRLSDGVIIGNPTPSTSKPVKNTVANSTLTDITILDATGGVTQRADTVGDKPVDPDVLRPVSWKGELPAPVTH
ncbi:hypothetical protein [Canibacter zhoujuaniae]|uniref:hypothetical protein n=1 Tax=Canibacter zhoujuaniae TaxID=2708343 RepID=UPI00141DA559|nr:hypothetical protein [Canibacter zhoujuaniae]